MPNSSHTPEQWDALIDQYLAVAPAVSQRRFCLDRNIPFSGFRSQYQRSPKFAGKRRGPRSPGTDPAPVAGFAPVRARTAANGAAPTPDPLVTIRLGAVAIECPAALGPELIGRIARASAADERVR